MRVRARHGLSRQINGAGQVLETPPFDELPKADPRPPETAPLAFRQNGTIADSATARELGRRGGQTSQLRARILRGLGLVELASTHKFHPYEVAGEQFAEHQIRTLAEMYDGVCGAGPASIAKTSALQLACSRFFYDEGKQTGDASLLMRASQLGDASRTNIANALELQSREADARKLAGRDPKADPLFVTEGE